MKENKEKIKQLNQIQTYLETEFNIPILHCKKFNRENPELIKIYCTVADLKFKLLDEVEEQERRCK